MSTLETQTFKFIYLINNMLRYLILLIAVLALNSTGNVSQNGLVKCILTLINKKYQ